MTRMRIMGLALVAVFAMSALAVSSASAKTAKTVLTLKTAGKGALTAGAALTASSSDLVFTTAAGNLECTSNILSGTLANNGSTKDKGTITSSNSTGTEPPTGKACKTTTPFGPAEIISSGFNWPVEFTTKGTSTVKGNKKVAFKAIFLLAESASCTYEASKVASTFKIGGPVELTTSAQPFKINKKTSNAACPASGTLTGHALVTSGGETVES